MRGWLVLVMGMWCLRRRPERWKCYREQRVTELVLAAANLFVSWSSWLWKLEDEVLFQDNCGF